jgi:probable HAF family extracellular repeat protein
MTSMFSYFTKFILSGLIAAGLLASSAEIYAYATFTGVVRYNKLFCISKDGNTVGGDHGLMWSEEKGYSRLINYNTSPGIYEVMAIADKAILMAGNTSTTDAFYWTEAEGIVDLGTLIGSSWVQAYDATADGTIIVGLNHQGDGAFLWHKQEGYLELGVLDNRPYSYSCANAISSDGTYIVGVNYANAVVGSPNMEYQAFRWTLGEGMIGLGDLPGGEFYSVATDVSDNGIVVGYSASDDGYWEPFRWSKEEGMAGIGHLDEDNCLFSEGVRLILRLDLGKMTAYEVSPKSLPAIAQN